MWGRRGCVRAEREFLQDHVIPDLVEGREQRVVCDDGSKMIIPFVQPVKNIEDEVTIGDDTTKVGQGVGHAPHLLTVVAHHEVALDEFEVAEHGVKVKHVCFAVADELVLDCAPDLVHRDAVLLCDVLKLANDRVEDLGEDDGLHAIPGRVVDGRSIREDVVSEFIALQGE
jgi:hypothetical protein